MNSNSIQVSRWWDIFSAFLLVVAMFTVGSRLEATHWANNLSVISYLTIFGTLAGMALGQSRFRLRTVLFFSLVYGIFLIGWQLAATLDSQIPWKERLLALGSRSGHVIGQLANQRAVTDSILFITVMAILFWILSVSAGYLLTRHGNAWLTILPIGMVLFTIHYFDPLVTRRSLYLAVYIFFSLLLVARTAYLHNQSRWKANRFTLSPHLSLDFIRFAFSILLAVILISWTIPALASSVPAVAQAAQPIREQWTRLRNRWNNAFASLRSSVGIYTDYYGDSVSLGRGSQLSDTPVIVISPPDNTPIGVRYYWRATVYDTYEDSQWVNTIFSSQVFNANSGLLTLPELQGRWEDMFEIIPTTFVSTLFSPGQPFWVNRNSNIQLVENPDNTFDIASFKAKQPVRPQQPYQVQSSLNIATTSQLRLAGTEYPTWITDRYLNIPDSITPRTRQLAQDITAGLDNPYDKVVAITDYLRNNIEYQETVPPIPNNQEPIDWFLFDLKKGFCNYYATAQVILLRSLGIPARWAIGYAQGERLADGRFLVRQADAHSWPEVYFPGLGWIEFEPTVSQPEILRLSGEVASNLDEGLTPEEEIDALRRSQREELERFRGEVPASESAKKSAVWTLVVLWIFIIGLVAGVSWFAWKYRRRIKISPLAVILETALLKSGIQPPLWLRQWSWRASLPSLTKAYQEINHALQRLGEHPQPKHTPAERAEQLSRALPPTQEPVEQLLRQYEIASYSQEMADYNTARQAGLEIRRISWKAALLNSVKRFQTTISRRRSILRR